MKSIKFSRGMYRLTSYSTMMLQMFEKKFPGASIQNYNTVCCLFIVNKANVYLLEYTRICMSIKYIFFHENICATTKTKEQN